MSIQTPDAKYTQGDELANSNARIVILGEGEYYYNRQKIEAQLYHG